MRGGLLLASVLMLGGCATYGKSLSLTTLEAQHASMTSKVVQVHGWLTPCHGRSCLMVEDRDYGLWLEQAGALERRMTRRGDMSVQLPPHRGNITGVSFGPSAAFDKQVANLRYSLAEVVVQARVTDECWSSPDAGEIIICADRANQLEPIRLVKVIQQIPLPLDPEEY